MRSTPILALAAAAISLLGGCAGPGGLTMVHTVLIEPLYSPYDVRAVGAPIPVRLIGAAPDGASAEETLAALTLPARMGARTARAETPADLQDLRLVFAFAPLSSSRICDSAAGAGAQAAGREVSAALCRGERELSYGIMRADARGPRDPGFRSAALHLLNAILPAHSLDEVPPTFGHGAP